MRRLLFLAALLTATPAVAEHLPAIKIEAIKAEAVAFLVQEGTCPCYRPNYTRLSEIMHAAQVSDGDLETRYIALVNDMTDAMAYACKTMPADTCKYLWAYYGEDGKLPRLLEQR